MNYKISEDRKTLTLFCDDTERKELAEMEPDQIQCDVTMTDWLQPLTCNSELEWIDPAETDDLTSAPMLGILGEERPFTNQDKTVAHRITGPNLVQEILERWAFMDYQVRSVLEDLRDKGQCVFVS